MPKTRERRNSHVAQSSGAIDTARPVFAGTIETDWFRKIKRLVSRIRETGRAVTVRLLSGYLRPKRRERKPKRFFLGMGTICGFWSMKLGVFGGTEDAGAKIVGPSSVSMGCALGV